MKTSEVKDRVINKISSIEDEGLLIEFEQILSDLDDSNNEPYQLDDIALNSIRASEKDIEEGRVFSHVEVIKNTTEWLKKK